MQGRIIKGIAGFYYVHADDNEIYECKARGLFRNQKIKPLVGDYVEIEAGLITDILPRKGCLIRPAVSGVDQALVIFAVTSPEPNLNLLDRFLVTMEMQNIPVTIAFNKNDIGKGDNAEKLADIYRKAGYKVVLMSVKEDENIPEILEILAGKTTVLAGPSGVGKSSFINRIVPDAATETGGLSEKIQRGKQTTRHSELFCVGEDTYVMDTPGFSSLFVENIEAENLRNYFPEFAPYEENCRFLGCVHIGEKQCGVKDAVSEGIVSDERYENYKLIYTELKNKARY